MLKNFFITLLIFLVNFLQAQTIDLSSVDEFFKITSILKSGKEVSPEEWKNFENSTCYKEFAAKKNPFVINSIKNTINIVFGNDKFKEKDSILSITVEQMRDNPKLMFRKNLLLNFMEINKNYDSLKSFRANYDFKDLINKTRQKLTSFLEKTTISPSELKPIYFLFITKDGNTKDNAIFVDFNLIYNESQEQRINFLAHESFHVYREKYENHDFNYKSDLFHVIDNFQNEGIADQIDKKEGYHKFFSKNGYSPEIIEIWIKAYNRAEKDLEKFQNIVIKFSKNEISEQKMVDEIIKIVKFNGHPIGFYMSNLIIKAGYKKEMIKTFYNPYKYFVLYNKSAKKLNHFQLNNEFMKYLKNITKEYYR